MPVEIFIEKLEARLKEKLPGKEAQFKMAPEIRLENQHDRYRNAAVLILLYPGSTGETGDENDKPELVGEAEDVQPGFNELNLVLMKRNEYEGEHSRQVSFPGGMHEKTDRDMAFTALRETEEEIGVDSSGIRILGRLSNLEIPVSGFDVIPYVGFYPGKINFRPDPTEVSYIIEVPLKDLTDPEIRKNEIRTIRCKIVKVPYFDIKDEKVWGATAMMLSEFLELVGEIDQLPA